MDEKVRSLFELIKIDRLTVRNRIVIPPMNTNMAYPLESCSFRGRPFRRSRWGNSRVYFRPEASNRLSSNSLRSWVATM
jgi:hypothetical protein